MRKITVGAMHAAALLAAGIYGAGVCEAQEPRPDPDMTIDAARAWRFAVLWPSAIVEHRAHLLARVSYLRSTVIEPAYASLRRSV